MLQVGFPTGSAGPLWTIAANLLVELAGDSEPLRRSKLLPPLGPARSLGPSHAIPVAVKKALDIGAIHC
jgi:hypothetical protein